MFAIVFVILGFFIGSFFNVCIYRIPREESIVFGRSHCAKCNHTLSPLDLVPVFSYLFLGGKCRYCKEQISFQYPLVELLTGLLYGALYLKFDLTWDLLFYGILVSILIIITFIDFEHKIIPNSINLFGALAALLMNILGVGRPVLDGVYGLLVGGGSLLTVALLSLLILRREGMGGGDIKLMGVIGLFLGWKMTLMALLLSVYIGGLAGIILIVFRLKKAKEAMAYGPFIALGTLITVFYGQDILSWYLGSFMG